MTTGLQKILESKAACRRTLADLPIGEKLRPLDAMRERTISPLAPQRHWLDIIKKHVTFNGAVAKRVFDQDPTCPGVAERRRKPIIEELNQLLVA
jgi:hypothetical protein